MSLSSWPALPARYAKPWRPWFEDLAAQAISPGDDVLDVGCGSVPTVRPTLRPQATRYIGLDQEGPHEPARALFDEFIQVPIQAFPCGRSAAFDVVVSWQVLEHVDDLLATCEIIRSLTRPGGRFLALLSGRRAAFSIINRVVPDVVGVAAMRHLLGREPESVFHAHYDQCTAAGIRRVFSSWTSFNVIPLFRGAEYFNFCRSLQVLYLAYEEWALRTGRENLATHYLVDAVA